MGFGEERMFRGRENVPGKRECSGDQNKIKVIQMFRGSEKGKYDFKITKKRQLGTKKACR
jgi:hypothetical protein